MIKSNRMELSLWPDLGWIGNSGHGVVGGGGMMNHDVTGMSGGGGMNDDVDEVDEIRDLTNFGASATGS